MSYQYQLRRGLASLWTSTNPVLPDGIQGYENDTGKMKIGDGVTAWTSLDYWSSLQNSGTVSEIGAALTDDDEVVVYDESLSEPELRKSLLSRVWTYISGKLASPPAIGGTTPAAGSFTTLTLSGFARLGESAPVIKTKKVTGTTASTEGASANAAHGLTADKIISVSVIVNQAVGVFMPPGYTHTAGSQFEFYFTGTNVVVRNHATNSENILSKTFTVLIVYEE